MVESIIIQVHLFVFSFLIILYLIYYKIRQRLQKECELKTVLYNFRLRLCSKSMDPFVNIDKFIYSNLWNLNLIYTGELCQMYSTVKCHKFRKIFTRKWRMKSVELWFVTAKFILVTWKKWATKLFWYFPWFVVRLYWDFPEKTEFV